MAVAGYMLAGGCVRRMTRPSLSALRAEFPIADQQAFFNHAGVAPTSLRARRRCGRVHVPTRPDRSTQLRGVGGSGRRVPHPLRPLGRGRAGRDCVRSKHVSWPFAGRVGPGLASRRPGSPVATELEYPSNVYPWLDLARRGRVVVDTIDAPEGVVTAAGCRGCPPARDPIGGGVVRPVRHRRRHRSGGGRGSL